MKKIISIIAVLAIVFSFSVTAFAATATMTVANVEVDVADGTQDVPVNVVFNMDEATSLYGVALNFELPDGVTLKSVDPAALVAICPSATGNDEVKDLASGSYSYFEGTVEGTSAVDALTIPCVFTVDTTVAKVYTISFAEGSGVCDIETYEAINATCPEFTITVKAANVVTYGEEETKTAIVPEKTVTLDGVEYTNVALFAGSLNLGEIKAALVGDDAELRAAGIKLVDDVKHSFDVSGEGTVEYKVLFYNITSAEADALNISTYYTVYDIVD